MQVRRHDWVYLRPDAEIAFGSVGDSERTWIGDWLARGNPLVVTRQQAHDSALMLGAALPLAHGVQRIACSVAPSAVLRSRNPVTVDEAIDVLPPVDAAALRRFAATIAGHALQLGLYGSTAWDYFAGGGYRHQGSDIDVICDVASSAGLSACLAAFSEGTRYFRSRLDGEIRFTGGRAVAWREVLEACSGGPAVVLAKSERDVALVTLHHVLAPLR